MPFNQCLNHQVPRADADAVWKCLVEAGVFITRADGQPFSFASGQQATLKVDAERVKAHPEIMEQLLGTFAVHPCVQEADVLAFVPNGMAVFAIELGKRIGKQVIQLVRAEGAAKTDMQFVGPEDQALAQEAGTICLLEDVSNSGLSAHAAACTLHGVTPGATIHTLSMLQRSQVDPAYEQGEGGISYHTYVRQDIPLSMEEFNTAFPDISVERV